MLDVVVSRPFINKDLSPSAERRGLLRKKSTPAVGSVQNNTQRNAIAAALRCVTLRYAMLETMLKPTRRVAQSTEACRSVGLSSK